MFKHIYLYHLCKDLVTICNCGDCKLNSKCLVFDKFTTARKLLLYLRMVKKDVSGEADEDEQDVNYDDNQ